MPQGIEVIDDLPDQRLPALVGLLNRRHGVGSRVPAQRRTLELEQAKGRPAIVTAQALIRVFTDWTLAEEPTVDLSLRVTTRIVRESDEQCEDPLPAQARQCFAPRGVFIGCGRRAGIQTMHQGRRELVVADAAGGLSPAGKGPVGPVAFELLGGRRLHGVQFESRDDAQRHRR